jgi:cell shape-determining protein MreD
VTRVLVFCLLGFLLITVLGAVQRLAGLEMVVLDVPLIVVLYLAIAARGLGFGRAIRSTLVSGSIDWSGGIAALVLGYLADLMAGAVKGSHALTLVVIFLLSLWAARHVFLAGSLSAVVVTGVASLVASSIEVLLRWILAGVAPGWPTVTVVASQAVICAALAPLVIRLLRLVDNKLAGEGAERGSLCR